MKEPMNKQDNGRFICDPFAWRQETAVDSSRQISSHLSVKSCERVAVRVFRLRRERRQFRFERAPSYSRSLPPVRAYGVLRDKRRDEVSGQMCFLVYFTLSYR